MQERKQPFENSAASRAKQADRRIPTLLEKISRQATHTKKDASVAGSALFMLLSG
jgi:hypothetical protein